MRLTVKGLSRQALLILKRGYTLDDKIKEYKEHKTKRSNMFPFLLIGAVIVILIVMVLSVTAQKPAQKTYSNNTGGQTVETKEDENGLSVLAVLKEIDTGSETMTITDTQNGQDTILSYSGTTNIINKYEKVIAVSQLNLGEMVDAYYDKNTSVLTKLQISNLAWEYKGVVNWSLNESGNSFIITNSNYKLPEDPLVIKDGKKLTLADLDAEDELVVKGYDREVWSILVSQGHGTIRFEDYEDFIGGTVYIGNRENLPIVSDMSVTIREGSYEIIMEKGSFKGTKKLTVLPFEEAVLDMGEFKLPPVQKGKVLFQITPEGADLYINDKQTDYSKAVELEYGEHTMKVALGGYMNYTGKLEVSGTSKTVSIDLANSQSQSTKEDGSTEDDRNNADNNTGSQKDNNTKDGDSNINNESNTTQDSNSDYKEVKAANNIYIQEPEGASAYFDGQFKGTVPVSFPKENGFHYITLIQAGAQTKTYSVEIKEDGEDVKLNFSLLDKKE